MKMLLQSCWLSSLLFVVSTAANVYPPAGLKPRYLATGTGISLPSTSSPPYPTGSSYLTSSILPSGVSSTAVPAPTPSTFYLVVADTGTPFDGHYIFVGTDTSRDGLYLGIIGSTEPDQYGMSVFSLSANGTLEQDQSTLVAAYFDFDGSGSFIFQYPYAFEALQETAAACEIVGGALVCQNGEAGVFHATPQMFIAEELTTPSLGLSPTAPSGSYEVTLLVVAV